MSQTDPPSPASPPNSTQSDHGIALQPSGSLGSPLLRVIVFALVSLFFALLSWKQITPLKSTTIKEHIEFAEKMMRGEELYDDLESLPHKGYFHGLILLHQIGFSFAGAALLVLTAGHVAAFGITYAIYRHFLRDRVSDSLLLGAAFGSLVVAALFIPILNPSPYYGQGSPNTHHNSTVILLKPVATLAFFLVIQELCHTAFRVRWILFAAGAMALSVIIKPTFAIVFVPAILPLILSSRVNLKHRILTGSLILVPSMLVLLLQYQSYYVAESQGREWVIAPFEVWQTQSDNIACSIIAAVAFPLAMGIFRLRQSRMKPYLLVAWMMTGIGLLQFALLAEYGEGQMLWSGNWIGGYLMGLSMLYTFSIAEFIAWLSEVKQSGKNPPWKFLAVYFLLVLHVTSGIVYDVVLIKHGKLPPPLMQSTLF